MLGEALRMLNCWDELHNVHMFERMELIVDYTAESRKPDPREVEPFGAMLIDYIAYSSGYELELD
jgi:hypothetical protein